MPIRIEQCYNSKTYMKAKSLYIFVFTNVNHFNDMISRSGYYGRDYTNICYGDWEVVYHSAITNKLIDQQCLSDYNFAILHQKLMKYYPDIFFKDDSFINNL